MDLRRIANKFLPPGAKVITPFSPKFSSAIQPVDLENDRHPEIVITYEQKGVPYLLVLKKYGNQWHELGKIKGQGYGVNYLTFTDITGDGNKEILIGWQIGSAWSRLDIYSIKDNELEQIAEEEYSWIELILQETADHKEIEYLALWSHVTGEAYNIEVYVWNGNDLVTAKAIYPYYFGKVTEYYEKKVEEMPGAAFYWYYLADAQIKAGMPEKALYSIERGISLNLEYPSKEQFLALKKKAIINQNS